MLSHHLETLYHWFEECRQGRAEFTASGMEEFGRCLSVAAETARILESHVVPAHARAQYHSLTLIQGGRHD